MPHSNTIDFNQPVEAVSDQGKYESLILLRLLFESEKTYLFVAKFQCEYKKEKSETFEIAVEKKNNTVHHSEFPFYFIQNVENKRKKFPTVERPGKAVEFF